MNSEELALHQEMKDVLSSILVQEQEISNGSHTCVKSPNKWMLGASIALSGGNLRAMRKDAGLDYYTAKRIYGLVMCHDEAKLFRKERAIQIAAHSAQLSEIGSAIAENILKPENADKLAEYGPKELQNIELASKLSMEQFDRVTGNNVQRIEVKHITTPQEAMDLIDSLPEAKEVEIIDL